MQLSPTVNYCPGLFADAQSNTYQAQVLTDEKQAGSPAHDTNVSQRIQSS